jgi:hypothetical protein
MDLTKIRINYRSLKLTDDIYVTILTDCVFTIYKEMMPNEPMPSRCDRVIIC